MPVVQNAGNSPNRQLAILDVVLDRAELFGNIDNIVGAAFAPDSRRLAIASAIVDGVAGQTNSRTNRGVRAHSGDIISV